MTWRLAKSLEVLRIQINVAAPNRSKASDGTIGDAAHRLRPSDHNPDSQGVVRALDITNDPVNGVVSHDIAEQLRLSRDPRIKYIISNGKIVSSTVSPWVWRPYYGANTHSQFFHLSVVNDARADDTTPWKVKLRDFKDPVPLPITIRLGDTGPEVKQLHQLLGLPDKFTSDTDAAVRAYQRKHGLTVDGIVGPQTWGSLLS